MSEVPRVGAFDGSQAGPPERAGEASSTDLEFAYHARPGEVARMTLGAMLCAIVATLVARYLATPRATALFYAMALFFLLCGCAGVGLLIWSRRTRRRLVLTAETLIVPAPAVKSAGRETRIYYYLVDRLRPGVLLDRPVLWVDHPGGPTPLSIDEFESEHRFEEFRSVLQARIASSRIKASGMARRQP